MTRTRRSPLALALPLIAAGVLFAVLALRPGRDVQPAPVYAPDAALALFDIVPGFRIELVASEPMIEAPVQAVFDEDGRLWVVEMPSYMPDAQGRGELAPTGRIVVLEDTDNDGKMDKSTVFLDGLVLPRSVLPCHGGALVIDPPNLIFARDTDGDGVADERRVLLSGFGGRENPEHAGNGLLYGLDNWIELSQHNVRFKFDGTHLTTQPTPVVGQWGITQDDFGRNYYTPNSEALRCDLIPKHYLARNPTQRDLAGINELICHDQSTHPAHPTRGVNRGYQEGTLRKDGTLANLTAACAPIIYRAAAFGDEFYGNAFICEPAGNLVKRLILDETKDGPRARNAYKDREFLTSPDERFRPVNTTVGPDGALYITDMYRGIIQHRTYLTEYLKAHAKAHGLEQPLGMGRIYRIVPDGFVQPPPLRMSKMSDEELAGLLAEKDAWRRITAQRLIVEHNATKMTEQLRIIAKTSSTPQRIGALWTLDALNVFPLFADSIGDPEPWLRITAWRTLERAFGADDNGSTSDSLGQSMIVDRDRNVRRQLALSAGCAPSFGNSSALLIAFHKDAGDPIMRSAVLSSLSASSSIELLDRLLNEAEFPHDNAQRECLNALLDCMMRDDVSDVRLAVLDRIAKWPGDRRGPLLLSRVAKAQRLDTDSPRSFSLLREPSNWRRAMQLAPAAHARKLAETDEYLDWPGKPPSPHAHASKPLSAPQQALFDQGQLLFKACIGCHSTDGSGTPGAVPPLAGSGRVLGAEKRLARILLNGIEGPLEAGGAHFEGVMPPAPLKNDTDLAAVMTYIRRSWGNNAAPVAPATVAEVRAKSKFRTVPWRSGELDGEK